MALHVCQKNRACRTDELSIICSVCLAVENRLTPEKASTMFSVLKLIHFISMGESLPSQCHGLNWSSTHCMTSKLVASTLQRYPLAHTTAATDRCLTSHQSMQELQTLLVQHSVERPPYRHPSQRDSICIHWHVHLSGYGSERSQGQAAMSSHEQP